MKYIFVWPYGWFDHYMYQDLFRTKKVMPFPLNRPFHFSIINFVRKVHRSHKVNRLLHLPYKDIWFMPLLQQIEDNTCVIFDTGILSIVSLEFLYKVKTAGKNVKMALFLGDSLHGPSLHIPEALSNILNFPWDARLSYDKNDCKEFGFQYLGPHIYSMLQDIKPGDFAADLYFVGGNKADRTQKVMQLYKICREHDLTVNFNLVGSPKNIRKSFWKNQKGIRFFKENIPYENVVSDVLASNCILEMVGKGQKVQTARYYEAVCYNKKLLTNNPSIKELSFYDPRYMKYFETPDDIDFAWIKKKEKIDYHYNGEFSPLKALEQLKRLLGDEE